MHTEPYLNFNGRCEEAIEFYKKSIGAKVTRLMRWKDSPDPNVQCGKAELKEKVMHANVQVGDTAILMSDGRVEGQVRFDGFSLCLNADSEADARRFFDALQDGGKVSMPLGKTFFSPCFGMVTDRFGVAWMVIVQ